MLFSTVAFGQDPSKSIHIEALISVDKVQQGSSFMMAVVMDIEPPFHINSSSPLDESFIPTKIEFLETEGVVFGEPIYPKGENQKLSFSEDPISVYSGYTVIKVPVETSSKLEIGKHVLKAKLSYQACNDQVCFAPKTVEVSLPVEVVSSSSKIKLIHPEIFGAKQQKAVRKKS